MTIDTVDQRCYHAESFFLWNSAVRKFRTLTLALQKPGLRHQVKNQTPTSGCNVRVFKDDLRENLILIQIILKKMHTSV